MKYEVLVIGGGGASYPGAFRLSKAGKTVIMADPKGVLGGNCLYQGCIPSKTIREMAELHLRSKRFFANISPNFELIQDHKDKVQEKRFKQHDEEIKENNVEFVKGEVQVTGDKTAKIIGEKEVDVEFNYLILGTGSEPFVPRIPGSEHCITSDDLYKYKTEIRKLPSSMVIIGGGYIALETATIFKALGTEVHVLVRSDKILRSIDQRLVEILKKMIDPEIDIKFNSPVLEVEKNGNELKVTFSQKGEKKEIITEKVVMATGRKPVLPKGFEKLGVKVSQKGVEVDESIRTNIPYVFAPGDVNGISPYFHSAVRQSLVASRNILTGRNTDFVNFSSIPVTVFTIPPIAYVGIITNRDSSVIEASYKFERDSRAQIYDELEGEVRLFFEKGSLRALGGWVAGIDAPSLINEIGYAVHNGLTAKQMAEFADQHPMSNESITNAVRSII
ncbi:dihydrolipoyl dehydrogenase [Sulfolobales archaeon HS-7]|nr:dihydrolipoyl dehydrogenase [Sulfolobales archaeon HS-7]